MQEGLRYTRLVYVVSTAPDQIAGRIMSDIGRGLTFLSGAGAYTATPYRVIVAVVRQQELNLVVDTVREVMGEGFSPLPPGAK